MIDCVIEMIEKLCYTEEKMRRDGIWPIMIEMKRF